MRPQTKKANMRDDRRRQGNKRTHSALRDDRRRKRANKRRKRHGMRATAPTKEAFTEYQLGECEGQVSRLNPKIVRSTAAELERNALKKENEKMQKYIRFLLWRIDDQQNKDHLLCKSLDFMDMVHKGRLDTFVV